MPTADVGRVTRGAPVAGPRRGNRAGWTAQRIRSNSARDRVRHRWRACRCPASIALPRPKAQDWRGFFSAAVDDPVLASGRQAADEAVTAGSTIIYVTGRPRRYRRDTANWLEQNGLPAENCTCARITTDVQPGSTKPRSFRRFPASMNWWRWSMTTTKWWITCVNWACPCCTRRG